jgi:hypothetical protein
MLWSRGPWLVTACLLTYDCKPRSHQSRPSGLTERSFRQLISNWFGGLYLFGLGHAMSRRLHGHMACILISSLTEQRHTDFATTFLLIAAKLSDFWGG